MIDIEMIDIKMIYVVISIISLVLFIFLKKKRELSERLLILGVGITSMISAVTYIEPNVNSELLRENLYILLSFFLIAIAWAEIFKDASLNWLGNLAEHEIKIKIEGTLYVYTFLVTLFSFPLLLIFINSHHISEYLFFTVSLVFSIVVFLNMKKTEKFNDFAVAICFAIFEVMLIHVDSQPTESMSSFSRVDIDGLMLFASALLLFSRGHYKNPVSVFYRNTISSILNKNKNNLKANKD